MSVLRTVSDLMTSVLGCRHERMSRLFTIEDKSYMVCLNCGHQVFYSMDSMRRLTRREVRRMRTEHGPVVAIRPEPRRAVAASAAEDPTLAA